MFQELTGKKAFRAADLGEVKAKVDIGRPEDSSKFRRQARVSWDCQHHLGEEQYWLKLNRARYAPARLYDDALVKDDEVKLSSDGQQDIFKVLKDGSFAWDLWLWEKPASNILKWDMDFPEGVSFHFQPKFEDQWLTDTLDGKPAGKSLESYLDSHGWLDDDESYSESYAVYSNKAYHIRLPNGKTKVNYRTGKLGHIKRPYVTDKNGWRVWADLKIDEKSKTLSITIPEGFYSKAVYPIYLDPNIGYTSVGALSGVASSIAYCGHEDSGFVTASSDGTADSVHVYIKTYIFNPVADCGFYNDSSGPNSRIDHGTVATPGSASWVSVSVSGDITSGNKYYAAHASNNYVTDYYDNVSGSNVAYSKSSTNTLPNPFGTSWSAVTRKYSQYIEYTEDSGTTISATAADGINIGESLARAATLQALSSDGLRGGESLSNFATFQCGVNDGLSVAESLSKIMLMAAVASDGLSLNEIIEIGIVIFASVADGFTAGEALARTKIISAEVIDGLAAGESLDNRADLQSISIDGAKIGEVLQAVAALLATSVDGISAGDSPAAEVSIQASIADGVDLGDSVVNLKLVDAVAADGLSMSESLAVTALLIGLAVDGSIFSESLLADLNQIIEAIATDGIDFSETVSPVASFLAVAADGLDIGDQLSGIVTLVGLAADGLNLSDLADRLKALNAVADDGLKMSEAVALTALLVSAAADGIEFGELLTGDIGGLLEAIAADGINLSETVSTVAGLMAAVADGVDIGDQISAIINLIATAIDGAVLDDAPAWSAAIEALAADGIVLSDSMASVLRMIALAVDGGVVSDSPAVNASLTVTVADGVQVGETLGSIMQLLSVATDGFKMGDVAFHIQPHGEVTITFSLKRSTIVFTVKRPGINFEV